MEDFFKKILIDYVSFINGYKNLIKSQNKKEDDFVAICTGKIGEYSFHYHGVSCRLEKLGVICEFNFLPENEFPIKFTTWGIYEFFITNSKWNGLNYSVDDIHKDLLKFVEKGKLVLLELFGRAFLIFQIKDTDSLND
jgi:hypothetical protein